MPPYANKDDEYLSRKSHAALCFRNIVDGIIGVTGSSTTSLTAFALRESGTLQMIVFDFMICFIDILIALSGTSLKTGNHPSPNCCLRHASSSFTIRYASSVSKSAGGSLNAK